MPLPPAWLSPGGCAAHEGAPTNDSHHTVARQGPATRPGAAAALVAVCGRPACDGAHHDRPTLRRPAHDYVTAFCHGDKLAAAGMNLGMGRDPGWSYNLEANPEAWLAMRGRTMHARTRMAAGAA